MRVFITGATGWIGSAVTRQLVDSGNEVLGLATSRASAAMIEAMGAQPLMGSLMDVDVVARGAHESDGAVHLASYDEVVARELAEHAVAKPAPTDGVAIEALGTALAGSNKPLVTVSGIPQVPGKTVTEADGVTADAAVANVALATRDVRSVLVRLPLAVHGEGDSHGLMSQLIAVNKQKAMSGLVDDGTNRWAAVHVDDAANLICIALAKASAGSVLHAVGDEGIAVRDIAALISAQLNLPLNWVTVAEFGPLAQTLAQDQRASSILTQKLLGWRPRRAGLLDDLQAGYYFS